VLVALIVGQIWLQAGRLADRGFAVLMGALVAAGSVQARRIGGGPVAPPRGPLRT
jgi:hypothetical protein